VPASRSRKPIQSKAASFSNSPVPQVPMVPPPFQLGTSHLSCSFLLGKTERLLLLNGIMIFSVLHGGSLRIHADCAQEIDRQVMPWRGPVCLRAIRSRPGSMLLSGMSESRREIAERHVQEGRRTVDRQRQLVALQRHQGHDTAASESLLIAFERSLRIFEMDLASLIKET